MGRSTKSTARQTRTFLRFQSLGIAGKESLISQALVVAALNFMVGATLQAGQPLIIQYFLKWLTAVSLHNAYENVTEAMTSVARQNFNETIFNDMLGLTVPDGPGITVGLSLLIRLLLDMISG
jgi:hypothetical protein